MYHMSTTTLGLKRNLREEHSFRMTSLPKKNVLIVGEW